MTLSIGGVAIGGSSPCRFVAELSNNANGKPDTMRRLIRAAKDAGADLIKTQCYDVGELMALRGDGPAPEPWGSEGWSMRHLYAKAATPMEWFEWIPAFCDEVGIPWFSSVFGLRSLAVLEGAGCSAYKIARLDSHSRPLVAAAASTGKPVIVSTAHPGMDAEQACRQIDVAFLYCPPNYPTEPSDVSLAYFGDLAFTGPEYIGLSSHCMDPLLPVAAVARGCKLIEMHFQLCEEPSELEAKVSLNQYQFNQMVHEVRRVETMLA